MEKGTKTHKSAFYKKEEEKIGSIFCNLRLKSANFRKLALFDRKLQKIEPIFLFFCSFWRIVGFGSGSSS